MVYARLTNFLFPVTCSACGDELPADDYFRICDACIGRMPLITGLYCRTCGLHLPDGGAHCFSCRTLPPVHYDSIRSCAEYSGIVRELIHSFKYRNRAFLSRIFGRMLIELLSGQACRNEIDYVIPVPMHPFKQYLRGYNQAELLAVPVAEYLRRPVLRGVLCRKKYTTPLFALSKSERLENLKDSFGLVHGAFIVKRTILLIDDVCTTTATIEECARALRAGGAKRVFALTVARD